MADQLNNKEVSEATADLGWTISGTKLQASFDTSDFDTGVKFVNGIASAASELNHHPDVALTYPEVGITLTSHDVAALTERDVALATKISRLAAQMGIATNATAA